MGKNKKKRDRLLFLGKREEGNTQHKGSPYKKVACPLFLLVPLFFDRIIIEEKEKKNEIRNTDRGSS